MDSLNNHDGCFKKRNLKIRLYNIGQKCVQYEAHFSGQMGPYRAWMNEGAKLDQFD